MSELTERHDVEVAHAVYRATSIGRVLALPVDLEAGEHLRDAAFRAVSRNGFSNSGVVLKLAKSKSFKSLAAVHGGAADEIGRLIDVLGIRKDADAVKGFLTDTPGCGRDWVEFFGINLRRRHMASRRRVSPTSLRKHGTQKAMWSLQPLAFDVATKEELLDYCPVCQCGLGWCKNFGINFCDRCGRPEQAAVDLRDFPQPLADIQDEAAVQLIADLVDPEAADRRSKLQLHPELTQLGRGAQFAVQMAGRFESSGAGWGGCLQVRSIERAGRAILEWPTSLENLLAPNKAGQDGEGDISALCSDQTLSPELRSLLKGRKDKCLGRVVVEKVDRSTSSSNPSAPIRQIGPMKHGRVELRRLNERAGPIHAVEAAVALLRCSPQARSIANGIGVPVPHLIDLFDEGLLPELIPVLGPLKTAPAPGQGVSLFKQLEPSQRTSISRDGLPLFDLAFALGGLNGKQWNRIFRAIVTGAMKATWIPALDLPIVQSVFIFDPDALAQVLSSGATTRSHADFVPLSQEDVAAAFGRSRTTIRNLVRNDLLPPNPTGIDVAEFRKNWMFLSEVRNLASLHGMALPNAPKQLAASSLARISIGDTTIWSRVGVQEHFGLDSGSFSFAGRHTT
ncbi:hypothetical protein [Rhizobium leguminosarum]|uniref:hypothetical protein n=1 Tax=Rhizobium leguminosarum TaxID=384 RepID=UPI00103E22D6|nr:hypothetical protein [Rhizobium leguminosarum]TCA82265.1 hypothetical protein E0H74_20885 [Rhizobium leguminosarum bv. viciae]TCA92728.1 hypothetical protein E0H76_22235 [Rhizobium leguminosarum bv. viciae]